jgi:hypothetical protein
MVVVVLVNEQTNKQTTPASKRSVEEQIDLQLKPKRKRNNSHFKNIYNIKHIYGKDSNILLLVLPGPNPQHSRHADHHHNNHKLSKHHSHSNNHVTLHKHSTNYYGSTVVALK